MALRRPFGTDPAPDAAIHRFAEFELDARTGELRRDGEPLPIARKSLMVLAYLVRNCGRVVSRSELMEALWPNIRVGEGSLHQAIWEIRKVLREAPDGPRFIETRWGRGYRFAVAVDTQKCPDNRNPASPTRAVREDGAEPSSSESSVRNRVTLAAVPARAVASATLVSVS
jgi:DNA-binding winged helix-turn-helix (wHTH) protein